MSLDARGTASFVAVLIVGLCAPSALRAQERDGAAWVALAREAIAGARFDSARIDLDRAAAASPTPELAGQIRELRDDLREARMRSAAGGAIAREGWTHAAARSLFGAAAFAGGSALGFGLGAWQGGFGRPPCGPDCPSGSEPEILFGMSIVSAISMFVLLGVASWLALDGPSIEGVVAIAPLVTVAGDGMWLGAQGAF